jgi:hypothetical protein
MYVYLKAVAASPLPENSGKSSNSWYCCLSCFGVYFGTYQHAGGDQLVVGVSPPADPDGMDDEVERYRNDHHGLGNPS